MARDRGLWREAEAGRLTEPVLVTYSFQPAAISLGYHQDEGCLDLSAVAARGFDVVRRPTGGAAVLHDAELTYAVVATLETGFGDTIHEIYDEVANALVRALASVGVQADRTGQGRPAHLACFAAAGGHEITVEGRKLVGSALRRGRRAFLQHGSILIGPGHVELAAVVRADAAERDRLRKTLQSSTIDLQALGVSEVPALGPALASALADVLKTSVVPGAPGRSEA